MKRKSSLSKVILNLFVKSQAVGELFLEFTYHPYRYIYKNISDDYSYKESSIRSTLNRLEKNGLINRKIREENKVFLFLTESGKTRLFKSKLRQKDLPRLQNSYVLVIFDIPEGSRVVRDALRRNLKEFGFKAWQKSVWVTNKDVYELVKSYVTLSGLLGQVIVLQANKLAK